ncbi:MAG: ABC transporter ATP-binding protein/permease [Clostridia bacterium]|nr:ABC transporter ATP-binding protein/permease [Clostridia bacterium]
MKHKKQINFEMLFESDSFGKKSPWITLFHLYKGNWTNILISTFYYLIKSSPVWIIPLVTASIINVATEPAKHSLNELWLYLFIVLVSLAQNIPIHTLYTGYLSKAIRYVEAGLRSSLVRKLQQLSISYHKELKSGKLQSKILRDVEGVEFLSRQVMVSLLPTAINVLIAIGITLSKSLTVTLFFLVTIPFSLILIKYFRKGIHKSNNDFRREIEEMSAKVSEMVEMIPVTRAHGLEKIEIERMDTQLEKVKERGYQLDIVTAIFGSSSWVTFQLFQVLCLIFTAYLAYQGKMPIGDVVMYQGYFNTILNQVSNIINIYPNIAKGFESIDSISEILMTREIEDNSGKVRLKNVEGSFTFENVRFNYKASDEPILKDFNLEVRPGECVAFVGESGAGKTTILNLIIGFNKPGEGRILIDGIDMAEVDLCSYRKFLAVVPQNNILFSGSIRDNITYGLPEVSEKKLWEIIKHANLKEVIDKFPDGIDTVVGEHGGKLSGGQRQRIAIARALIRDPRIIVLDEATSALDNISEFHVQKAMRQLIKGRTTFIVAHRLSTIREADRIVVVKDGKCIESGTYEDLISQQGEFYKLKKLQA